MGTIRVRVASNETSVTGAAQSGGAGVQPEALSDIVPFDTQELAESLKELTGELGELFADMRRVAGFNLDQVQVGLEISAEGGFSLIGSAKAGGKGAITLSFTPKRAGEG